MKTYSNKIEFPPYDLESLRLEGVVTCVGFDDLLDLSLSVNHPHFDTMIVVTSHDDRATQQVARKHGALCVQTDLFKKNNRNFNKGAAINVGFDRFQYHGWRMHLDSDILLPDNYRRILFNHTHLERDCIYGCDRMDVAWEQDLISTLHKNPQHVHSCLVNLPHGNISARYVDPIRGYVPIGFFQLWHAQAHKEYPYSLGTAAHDDVMFAATWPLSQRRHLPTVVCHHVSVTKPKMSENWEGRKSPRIPNERK